MEKELQRALFCVFGIASGAKAPREKPVQPSLDGRILFYKGYIALAQVKGPVVLFTSGCEHVEELSWPEEDPVAAVLLTQAQESGEQKATGLSFEEGGVVKLWRNTLQPW